MRKHNTKDNICWYLKTILLMFLIHSKKKECSNFFLNKTWFLFPCILTYIIFLIHVHACTIILITHHYILLFCPWSQNILYLVATELINYLTRKPGISSQETLHTWTLTLKQFDLERLKKYMYRHCFYISGIYDFLS